MWLILQFWKTLGTALALLGLYYFPSDAIGWEDAAKPWQDFLAMVDQNTALWAFAFAALIYIAWIDARPFFQTRLWQKKRTARVAEQCISLGEQLFKDVRRIEVDDPFKRHFLTAAGLPELFLKLSQDSFERREEGMRLLEREYGLRVSNALSALIGLGFDVPNIRVAHYYIQDIAENLAGVGYALKERDIDLAKSAAEKLKQSLIDR